MKVLGLTGRCGSGKNEVAKILHKQGAALLDADELGHDLLEQDSVVKERVAFAFPESYDAAKKQISRKILGDLVFGKNEKLATLNGIIQPALKQRVLLELEHRRQQSPAPEAVAINAALLQELGLTENCDQVWVVDSDTTTILKRLRSRGITTQKALSVMSAQRSSASYIKEADVVLRNNADLDTLKQQVVVAYKKLLAGTLARTA